MSKPKTASVEPIANVQPSATLIENLREVATLKAKRNQLSTAKSKLSGAILAVAKQITDKETEIYKSYTPTEPIPPAELYKQLELFDHQNQTEIN